MKIYKVQGYVKGFGEVNWISIDSYYNNAVKVSLKRGYDKDLVKEDRIYPNRPKDYKSLLFNKDSSTTARKFIKLLGLKVKERII